jgi:hypothetical protein
LISKCWYNIFEFSIKSEKFDEALSAMFQLSERQISDNNKTWDSCVQHIVYEACNKGYLSWLCSISSNSDLPFTSLRKQISTTLNILARSTSLQISDSGAYGSYYEYLAVLFLSMGDFKEASRILWLSSHRLQSTSDSNAERRYLIALW